MPIPVLAQVSAASNLLPAVVGVRRLRVLDRSMKILTLLCILSCLEIVGEYILGMLRSANYFLSDYYRVIEVSLLCAVFYYATNPKQSRWVLLLFGSVFAVVWGVDLIFFGDPARLNSLMSVIARCFLMGMSAMVIWMQIKDERSTILERSEFWAAAAVILYSSGTMAVLGLGNFLLHLGRPYFVAAWHINWILFIVANVFYTKGMLCKPQV